MTWNEFKEFVDKKLTETQKDYNIDYIDFSWADIMHIETYIDDKTQEIVIH